MAPPLPPNWFLGAAGSDTPVHTGSSKCSKQAGADSAPCSRSTAALEHGTPSLCLLDLKKKNKMSQEVCWIPNLKAATHKKNMQPQPLLFLLLFLKESYVVFLCVSMDLSVS